MNNRYFLRNFDLVGVIWTTRWRRRCGAPGTICSTGSTLPRKGSWLSRRIAKSSVPANSLRYYTEFSQIFDIIFLIFHLNYIWIRILIPLQSESEPDPVPYKQTKNLRFIRIRNQIPIKKTASEDTSRGPLSSDCMWYIILIYVVLMYCMWLFL